MYKNNPYLKNRSRILRANQTKAEGYLCQRLRDKRLDGYKFYRQFSVANFILDFYCPKSSLGIEIDGGQHADRQDYDSERTKILSANEIKVLRFWNNDVLQNIEGIGQKIREQVSKRP